MPDLSTLGVITTTAWVIIGVTLVSVIYDVYLFAAKKPTISDYIIRWGWYKPWVPFLFGFLMGHWFA